MELEDVTQRLAELPSPGSCRRNWRQLRVWFENYLEDHLELTDEVKAKLDESRRENLIPKLKPALDALVNNGIFIRPELIASGLRKVDE